MAIPQRNLALQNDAASANEGTWLWLQNAVLSTNSQDPWDVSQKEKDLLSPKPTQICHPMIAYFSLLNIIQWYVEKLQLLWVNYFELHPHCITMLGYTMWWMPQRMANFFAGTSSMFGHSCPQKKKKHPQKIPGFHHQVVGTCHRKPYCRLRGDTTQLGSLTNPLVDRLL